LAPGRGSRTALDRGPDSLAAFRSRGVRLLRSVTSRRLRTPRS